jgi:hypothetical protein
MIEQQTGLPIGMRRLNCPHAPNGGIGAMQMERVAVDFYDRNCKTCIARQPVGIPNISELVDARDREIQIHEGEILAHKEAEGIALQKRSMRRQADIPEADHLQRALLTKIQLFDEEPSDHNAALLREAVKALGNTINSSSERALYDLLEADSNRALVALEILEPCASVKDELFAAAARLLESNKCKGAAARILSQSMPSMDPEKLEKTLDSIIDVAVSLDPFGFPKYGDSAPLIRAFAAAKRNVQRSLEHRMRRGHTYFFATSCYAASLLVPSAPDWVSEILSTAVACIMTYDGDMAETRGLSDAFEDLITASLRSAFTHADDVLFEGYLNYEPDLRSFVVNGYIKLLRELFRDEKGEHPQAPTDLGRQAFRRLIDTLALFHYDEAFDHIVSFLRYAGRTYSLLIEESAQQLLGLAAILATDEKKESLLEMPRRSPLENLNEHSRRQSNRIAIDVIIKTLGEASSYRFEIILPIIIQTLEGLDERHISLRATLVESLGKAGEAPYVLPQVISLIYRAMVDRSQVIRSAAATAYGSIASNSRDNLPTLMHQTFLVLLSDAYVIVHSSAVRALRSVGISNIIKEEVLLRLRLLIKVYEDDRGSGDDVLNELLHVYLRSTGTSLPIKLAEWITGICKKMPPYNAVTLLSWYRNILGAAPNYADALVTFLCHKETPDHELEKIVQCLDMLSSTEIYRVAERTVEQLLALQAHLHHTDDLLRILMSAGGWRSAERLAVGQLQKVLDVPRDREWRNLAQIRASSTMLETALEEARIVDARHHLKNLDALLTTFIDGKKIDWPLSRPLKARVDLLRNLDVVASRNWPDGVANELEETATIILEIMRAANRGKGTVSYSWHASLSQCLASLLRWERSVRGAELESNRFLRSAKIKARDIGKAMAEDERIEIVSAFRIRTLLRRIEDIQDAIEIVPEIARGIFTIAVPLPDWPESDKFTGLRRGAVTAEAEGTSKFVGPISVLLTMEIDGVPVQEPHILAPNVLHDFEIEARISQWPDGAEILVLDALTVEPSSVVELPKFEIRRKEGQNASIVIRERGRILIRVAQMISARPLDVVYRAEFYPQHKNFKVDVDGQRRLRVLGYDDRINPETGYQQADRRLLSIRDSLRRVPGLGDSELDAFLLLMINLAKLAGQSLQDNIFPGPLAERDFQAQVAARLRWDPRIGSRLIQHSQVSAGFTDLEFQGLVLELKVENRSRVTMNAARGFSQQAAQYTTGNDRRLGVICVFDGSPKTEAPGSLLNDIDHIEVRPGGEQQAEPLILGLVIIRGNLRRPSDFSR